MSDNTQFIQDLIQMRADYLALLEAADSSFFPLIVRKDQDESLMCENAGCSAEDWEQLSQLENKIDEQYALLRDSYNA